MTTSLPGPPRLPLATPLGALGTRSVLSGWAILRGAHDAFLDMRSTSASSGPTTSPSTRLREGRARPARTTLHATHVTDTTRTCRITDCRVACGLPAPPPPAPPPPSPGGGICLSFPPWIAGGCGGSQTRNLSFRLPLTPRPRPPQGPLYPRLHPGTQGVRVHGGGIFPPSCGGFPPIEEEG